ncbi:hypothetical protein QQX98_010964 [Neonectria punicea]|uniref:Alcohol dehydrogenase-like C-terminal domain-containing protein n=1 Tax=Neonectria punicea TaxID=979145 RepID=A0ABR1GMZ7_9HYPO
MGYRTIAIDNREAGRTLATEVPPGLSPDLVLDSTSSDAAAAQILEFTNGEGIAAAIWRFDPSVMVFRELVIMGSYVASADSTRRMMDVVERSGVRSHVTRVAFNDIPKL